MLLVNKAVWEWGEKAYSCMLSHVWLFATPRTVAHKAPLFMEFSRQEYWSGLPFPSLGDLPYPGIQPGSPSLQADYLLSEPPEKPIKSEGLPKQIINKGKRVTKAEPHSISDKEICLCCHSPRKLKFSYEYRVYSSGSDGKASICNAGDPGSIPGLGRSPGEGNSSPLQYSCLENPMDCGAW